MRSATAISSGAISSPACVVLLLVVCANVLPIELATAAANMPPTTFRRVGRADLLFVCCCCFTFAPLVRRFIEARRVANPLIDSPKRKLGVRSAAKMAVYHFTVHAYRSWRADNRRGYVKGK